MQKMYSNMNLELNVALKCITIILNGAKDLVRVHANKSKEIVYQGDGPHTITRNFIDMRGADYDQDFHPRSSH
jgi:hypothetical protein